MNFFISRVKINVVMCLFSASIFSQISNPLPSSTSIAQTSVSDTHNWAAFNNVAMLGYVDKTELGLQFENRYLISELSTKNIQFSLPTNSVNVGLSFSHFGYSLYHEMIAGIGFARNFSGKFSLGVQFDYYSAFFTASNSYHGAFFPQVGLGVTFSPVFTAGFTVLNPFQTNIQTEFVTKRLPSVFSLGTQYFFSPELVWRTQIDKEVSSNYRFATGFEYQMLQKFNVKLGMYCSDYLVSCLGIGFISHSFRFDLNCDLHPLLGIKPLAAISYSFN
ncbi:MAG: hypothetical protein WCK78_13960 [Paludibacter sp.]